MQDSGGSNGRILYSISRALALCVRSLGAEQVINYTKKQVAAEAQEVALVLDTVGGTALEETWPCLKRGGTLVSIAGQPDKAKARELGVRAVRFSFQITGDLLRTIARLIEEGPIWTVVGQTFPFTSRILNS